LEGSVFIAGAAIQWLRDGLGLLEAAEQSEEMAASVEDNAGVYFVPAFVGLGAPHWVSDARGLLVGLTRGTKREHIVRAALEAMAYGTMDVLRTMEEETALEIQELRVDGGAALNDWLIQFQADLLGIPLRRPGLVETTALGAAGLAGLATGVWSNADDFLSVQGSGTRCEPGMSEADRSTLKAEWDRAIRAAIQWAGDQ
jgi:glycerol kinase